MSFFSKLKAFFHNLFGHLPKWEQAAASSIKFAAPLTEEIVLLAAGEPAEKEVQSIIGEVQSDMAVASGILTAGAPSTSGIQTVTNALNSVKSNLSGLLTAGHIKNPANVEKVTGIANTIIGEVEAILSEVPTAAAPTPAAPATPSAG
jgi:hypothetical protein